MRIRVYLLACSLFLLLAACSKKDNSEPLQPPPPPAPPPVVISPAFTATVNGQAPNATITLVNTTTGAETYKWTFSKGAGVDSSIAEQPAALTVDKKGDFTITLSATKGTITQTVSKTVTITGSNAILSYTNVKFGIHNLGSVPYCYSVSENKLYQRNEINTTTGPKIDLVFYKDGINSFTMFLSPQDLFTAYPGLTVPGAKKTEIMNYQHTVQFAPQQFDELVSDSTLASLNIVENNTMLVANPHQLPAVVLFKTQEGRKGVIKLKEHGTDHIIADIKVQKY